MLALRRLLAGAAVISVALAPRAARGQDTSKAAAPNPYARVPVANTKADSTGKKAAAKININTAGRDSLKTLKGIGDAYADAIIKGRPYKKKKELVERKIISPEAYAGIKDLITAKNKGQ